MASTETTAPLFIMTMVDRVSGARIDTFDDEMTEQQLDAYLANALETATDRDGGTIYRFADGWYSHLQIAE